VRTVRRDRFHTLHARFFSQLPQGLSFARGEATPNVVWRTLCEWVVDVGTGSTGKWWLAAAAEPTKDDLRD